jgi:hypothetical protein
MNTDSFELILWATGSKNYLMLTGSAYLTEGQQRHIRGREMTFALEVFTRRLEPGSGITIPLVYLEGF